MAALTLAHLREKGFRDTRWTAEDKRDQLQDVIKLHNRDKEQTGRKVKDMRKRQVRAARDLAKEVVEYRELLDAARGGDKQMLRNTLRPHRPTQLAFGSQSFDRAIEHLEQSNFSLRKEVDRLRALTNQRAVLLLRLEKEKKSVSQRQQGRDLSHQRDATEQALTSQITNCVVKQNAAASVNHTYQNILAILRKDKLYFDAVLGALHSDHVTQCGCVVRATQLGQAAAEDVARLREEARAVEAGLRQGVQERASAVRTMRAVVDGNKRICRSHVRAESSTDLRLAPTTGDGAQPLLKELDRMEGVMQRLQATTLVSSHLDVLPRFEEQQRQQQRLARQAERRELARNEVLARRNHAALILHDLKHNMSEAEEEGEREESQLRGQMADEAARREAAMDERQKLCSQMVSVRTALYSIIIVLNQVKPTQAVARAQTQKYDWELEQEFIDDLYFRKHGPSAAPEANAMAMLKNVFMKVNVLLAQLQAEPQEVPDQQRLLSRALLPDVVAARRQRADQVEEELGVLMHSADTFGDAKVPTRESIKDESEKIIRMARKLNDAEQTYDRAKRIRFDEKWV